MNISKPCAVNECVAFPEFPWLPWSAFEFIHSKPQDAGPGTSERQASKVECKKFPGSAQ